MAISPISTAATGVEDYPLRGDSEQDIASIEYRSRSRIDRGATRHVEWLNPRQCMPDLFLELRNESGGAEANPCPFA